MNDWDKLMEPAREALEALIAEGDAMADRIEALVKEVKDERAAKFKMRDERDAAKIAASNYADFNHTWRKRAERLEEALIWCSGSADFNEGGVAREGWLKVCAPLLTGGKDE